MLLGLTSCCHASEGAGITVYSLKFRPIVLWAAATCVVLAGCTGRPSATSLSSYQSMLIQEGRLRTETAPADAPYTAEDLVRNFERIALRVEANSSVAGSDANSKPTALQRWTGPLRYRIDGTGATQADRNEVDDLMRRIAGLTGIDARESLDAPNFRILITTPNERDAVAADLARTSARSAMVFDAWRNNPRIVCISDRTYQASDANRIVGAIAVIGSETRGVLRTACLHEEIVQALGLANDHPAVRPSIFNDDGEFALLTKHDEDLLRILFDPRLETGMTAAEAMPIVREIVRGLAP